MSKAHVIAQSVVSENTSITGGNKTYTGTERFSLDRTGDDKLEIGTDAHIPFTIPRVCELQSIVMLATTETVIKTNDSGSPADTITLKPNVPYIWNTDSYHSNPFGTNVTSIYVTNAAISSLQIDALVGATS